MTRPTHTIDMGEYSDDWGGQTITIKAQLSFAGAQRIDDARAAISVDAEERANSRRVTLDISSLSYAVEVVKEAVIEWTLVGFDGEVLPATRAGVLSEEAPNVLLDTAIGQIMKHYEDQAPKVSTS